MRMNWLFAITLLLVAGLTTIGVSGIGGISSHTPASFQASSVTSSDYVGQGKQALYNHNILLAKEKFLAAVSADSTDQEAQLFLGVTRLAAIYEEGQNTNTTGLDSVREIAELFGITFTKFSIYDTQATSGDKLPDTAPATGKVFEFISKKVLPEVDESLKNLEKVTSVSFSSALQPPALAKTGNTYIIDYADVLTLKTMIYALKASMNLLLAYDFNVNIPSLIKADPKGLQDIRKLVENYPAFATPKEPALLTAAKTALHSFVVNYNLANDEIAVRSGQTGHLFVLDAPITNELGALQTLKLAEIKAALADVDASLNGPHLYSFAKGDDHNRTVDLSKLFNAAAPVNIRSKIINMGNNDVVPDLTFGGIMPLGVVSQSLSEGAAAAEWELAWKKTTDQYSLLDVAFNGSVYVAIGSEFGSQGSFQGYIVTSTDGVNWTKQSSLANTYFFRVKWAGDKFWIIGYGSANGQLFSSPDGLKWTSQSYNSYNESRDIAWGNNRFVKAGGINETSPDGINWTGQSAINGITTSVIWAENQFVSSGFSWVSDQTFPLIRTSPDGVNWTTQNIVSDPLPNGMFSRLTWSGSMFVAFWTGFNNMFDPETVIFTSPDGINWTKRTAAVGIIVSDVYSGDGKFIAVGNGGMLTSPDGVNWSERKFLTDNSFSAITYAKSRFLVVGNGGVHINTGLPAPSANISYTVTSTVSGTGGIITPASSKVKSGAITTFILKPDYGYETGSVYGCGGKLSNGRYVTGPITEDCTVTASFNALPMNLTITSKPLSSPLSYSAKSGVINFTVTGATTQEELALSVSPSDSWIVPGAVAYSKGKGSLKFSVTLNESVQARLGSITIAGQSYSIGQTAMPAKLTVTLNNSGTFLKSGGSVAVAVAIYPADGTWSVSGVKWTPSTITDWLQGYTVGAVQVGSSTLTLSAGNNVTGKRRSAVLTLQSGDGKSKKTVTVNQGD